MLVGMKSRVMGLLDLRIFIVRHIGYLFTWNLGVSCRPLLINLGSPIKVVKTLEHHLKISLIIIKSELPIR